MIEGILGVKREGEGWRRSLGYDGVFLAEQAGNFCL
jgi:hypothetical protein